MLTSPWDAENNQRHKGQGAHEDQIKGKAKTELKYANLPAAKAELAPKGDCVPRPYRLKETKRRLAANSPDGTF